MTGSPILFEVDGAVASITLNRAAAGNTIDLATARTLLQAAIRCDTDPRIRCVKLTGSGKLFCGGGDIVAFSNAGEGVGAFLSELAGTLHMALTRLMRMAKPLLTLVNGPAAGAGLSLAICGDIVLAAKSASFSAAYGTVGLTPDGGLSWLLPRLVGLRRAQEMIIMNQPVSAAEAADIGLITRVVADQDLAKEGTRIAAKLADAATGAIAGARSLLLESSSSPLEAQLERETRSISGAGGSAECREGVSAFLARRAPDYSAVP